MFLEGGLHDCPFTTECSTFPRGTAASALESKKGLGLSQGASTTKFFHDLITDDLAWNECIRNKMCAHCLTLTQGCGNVFCFHKGIEMPQNVVLFTKLSFLKHSLLLLNCVS